MTPPATAERVSDLFLRLGDDSGLLAEYGRDPEQTMAAAGLSGEQVATVLGEEPERVRALVDAEFAADAQRRRLIVTPRMVIMTAPSEDDEEEPAEPEPSQPEPSQPQPEPSRPEPKPKPKHRVG
ncbi:MAG: hypothetical protein ACM3QU_03495 [Verrucomicrobiota bacterium]